VEAFTPPLLGTYKVANITSYSRFGLGAYLSMVAIGLLIIAWLARDTKATPRDVPAILRSLPDRIGRGSGDEEPVAGQEHERIDGGRADPLARAEFESPTGNPDSEEPAPGEQPEEQRVSRTREEQVNH
jgi:hypothetical protein